MMTSRRRRWRAWISRMRGFYVSRRRRLRQKTHKLREAKAPGRRGSKPRRGRRSVFAGDRLTRLRSARRLFSRLQTDGLPSRGAANHPGRFPHAGRLSCPRNPQTRPPACRIYGQREKFSTFFFAQRRKTLRRKNRRIVIFALMSFGNQRILNIQNCAEIAGPTCPPAD